LINRGMDVNSVDSSGNTLLMQAVQRDNMDLFDYLLKRRARINTRNRNGETALSLAAYKGKCRSSSASSKPAPTSTSTVGRR
jgi:ankyrin repeat protein